MATGLLISRFSSLYFQRPGYLPNPKPLDGWQLDTQQRSEYIQKFIPTDKIRVQYSISGYEGTARVVLTSACTTDVLELTPTLIYSSSVRQVYTYEVVITGLAAGLYELSISFSNNPDVILQHSLFEVSENIEDSFLIEYNNYRNDFDTIFGSDPFHFRIIGSFLPSEVDQAGEFNSFRDQRYRGHLLSALPYETHILTVGGQENVPNWVGRQLNHIFSVSHVLVDGVEYSRSEGAVPERVDLGTPSVPLMGYKITLETSDNYTYFSPLSFISLRVVVKDSSDSSIISGASVKFYAGDTLIADMTTAEGGSAMYAWNISETDYEALRSQSGSTGVFKISAGGYADGSINVSLPEYTSAITAGISADAYLTALPIIVSGAAVDRATGYPINNVHFVLGLPQIGHVLAEFWTDSLGNGHTDLHISRDDYEALVIDSGNIVEWTITHDNYEPIELVISPPSFEDAVTNGIETSVSLIPTAPEIRFTAVVTGADTGLPLNGANVLFAVLEETYLIDGTTDSSGTYTTAVPITRTQWETYINDEEWGGVRWEISHYPEGYPQRLVYLNPGPSFEDIVDNGISITIALEKPTPQPRANILLNTQVPALVANGGAWTGTAQNILPVDSEGFGGLNVHFQRAVSQALDGVTFQSGDIATYSCELELKSTTGQQFGILYYRGSTLLSGTHTVYVDGVKIAEGISGASWIVIGDNASHYVEVLTTLTGAPERLNLIVGADVTQGGDMKRIKLESSTEADGYRASQWVPNVND